MAIGDAVLLTEPPRSPQRVRGSPSPKSPVKLSPLERKERDRQRLKDQAQRRVQAIKDRDAEARTLLLNQRLSVQWHDQERQEEALVLRRLERDLVDVQRGHPAAAGYRFGRAKDARDVTKHSPVFQGYSPALCPASQASLLPTKVPAVAVIHPSFSSYCVAKHNDATAISPVFFFVRYSKIPLEEIVMDDLDGGSEDEDDEEDDDAMQTHEQFLARQLQRDGPGAVRVVTITKLEPTEERELEMLLRNRFVPDASAMCLVCRGTGASGCPGCFAFSHETYRNVQAAKSTQRLKTPKTHAQEADERHARYRGLRLKVMGFGRRSEEDMADDDDSVEDGDNRRRPTTTERHAYYVDVLADIHAVRKHRTVSVSKHYVTLHIKTLPVGNLITLRVDVKASIAYVYELYRSSIDTPNRPIHLLLPTTHGLFYLNEVTESATDTRCGLVNGDFLVEDFHLVARPPASPLAKRPALRDAASTPEFLLVSVAILSDHTTPHVVASFVQQNFHFDDDVVAMRPCIEYAIARLPPTAMSDDLLQRRLVPHVQRLQEFAKVSAQLELVERERERTQVLWIAYQERKRLRLEHAQRQRRQARDDGIVSRKVVRAIAYFEMALDATSNPHRPRVMEDRLAQLWRCAQVFDEYKLCKNGRLVDAENTAATRSLIQRHVEATVSAFDAVLSRSSGAGPLALPIRCVGTRLVVRIGTRLGCSTADNMEYGLVLDLTQEFQAESKPKSLVATKRGFTKKQLTAMADEQHAQAEAAASWRCDDAEWKAKDAAILLCTGSDFVRPPFRSFPWLQVALAYRDVLQSFAFQLAQLDAFNGLARVLQRDDAQLSKAQIAAWQADVERFGTELKSLADRSPRVLQSQLLRATQRVLAKKGRALLSQRRRQRRDQRRARDAELERLQQLQESQLKPPETTVTRLKRVFVETKAPAILGVLEPTPLERLRDQAEKALGRMATAASAAATAAKKEYNVRAL